jgi:multidrug efflux pump subunit AcrA (membrane-fusion protein)
VVTARVQSNLGFRVPGKVVERLVNTGDFVKQGKPLMRIDSIDLALAIAAQAAAVASARALAVQTSADETPARMKRRPGRCAEVCPFVSNFWSESCIYKY